MNKYILSEVIQRLQQKSNIIILKIYNEKRNKLLLFEKLCSFFIIS